MFLRAYGYTMRHSGRAIVRVRRSGRVRPEVAPRRRRRWRLCSLSAACRLVIIARSRLVDCANEYSPTRASIVSHS